MHYCQSESPTCPSRPSLPRLIAAAATAQLVRPLLIALAMAMPLGATHATETLTYDVVIYGGTSSGVAAAIQAAKMGCTVVVIEPGTRLGGLTTAGLGATDIGNKQAIGGLARQFYQRVYRHYQSAGAWPHESPEDYSPHASARGATDTMWTFEPHVAERILNDWLSEYDIHVRLESRLDRQSENLCEGGVLPAIPLEGGERVAGHTFIDATYEGDLMAWAGVSFVVGREAADEFDESLAGVQTTQAWLERYTQHTHPYYHQFSRPIDPYNVPGDPSSGLLKYIQATRIPADGTGDAGVQGYCYRMTQTDVPQNRLDWTPPAGYKEEDFELLLRYFDAGETRLPLQVVRMPNRKTDTNNNGVFSTDYIGGNHAYPEADYQTREQIVADHRYYQQGLMWTLAQNPRVPKEIREWVSSWGLCKDEFTDNDGWPTELYVREARRMRSDYVMTQANCEAKRTVDDPIALAAYQIDSHHVHRFVRDGQVQNEGMLQVGGIRPYPISLSSIRPRAAECANLLVPVCVSATHVAYGSIRMEPVFMELGQAAGTVAALARQNGEHASDVPYASVQRQLASDNAVLAWPPK